MRIGHRRGPSLVTSLLLFALACALGIGQGGCQPRIEGRMNLSVKLPMDRFTLANGLEVVLHREPAATSTLVHVRYHVGSKDDPQGRAGFAHFFEHLMFRGSRFARVKDYTRWIDELGGQSNASTGLASTDYFAQVPPNAVERALWLEADRMAYPLDALDQAAFDNERNVVKNEWREHYEDAPLGNLMSFAREAVFDASHPYGKPTIGDGAALDAVTLEEARTFARTYYRPNNATLVVCGAIDTAAVRAFILTYFKTIPPGPSLSSRVMPPPQIARAWRVSMEAGVDAPAVAFAWALPPTHAEGSDELSYGFRVVASTLRHRLVMKDKVATDVDWDIEQERLGGMGVITVHLRAKESPRAAASVLDEVLAETSRLGRSVPWDNFRDYKTQVLVRDLSRLESMDGRARAILHGLDFHGFPDTIQLEMKRMQAVDAEGVGSAIERFLIDRPYVTLVVTPEPGAPRAGRRR